jgi:hypothetical protein
MQNELQHKDVARAMRHASSRFEHKPKVFKSYSDSDIFYQRLQARGVYDISRTFSWFDTHR